jgi:DNA-binding helix-hairpin-helix protein with protein kinase domain
MLQPSNPPPLYDASGRALKLGSELGRGGEGTVHAVEGQGDLVAKLYHHTPNAQKSAKILAMARLGNERLLKLAAWPLSPILAAPKGGPVRGFLMPRISGHKPAFNLYSPKLRLQEFPSAGWAFLIHAAANAARAFAVIHEAGHVIGDVNHGNLVVAGDATVKLIDCDSFQVTTKSQQWFCEVGVSTHQPPEFQSLTTYKNLLRTANHDNFGLAVIVFQLLFMARHPFSGRYLGAGDMPIEQAIREYRFAYGKDALTLQMKPPPGSLGLDGINRNLTTLFERAFGRDGSRDGARPKPAEWIAALQELARSLRRCAANPAHEYWNGLAKCPWCEIETMGGFVLFPVVFLPNGAPQPSGPGLDVAALWQEMRAIPDPGPPPPLPAPAALCAPRPKPSLEVRRARRSLLMRKALAVALALTALIVLPFSRFHGAAFWPWAVATLALLAWTAIPFLRRRRGRNHLQQALAKAREQWSEAERRWASEAGTDAFAYRRLALEKLKTEYDRLPHERLRRLRDLETNREGAQLAAFLDRCPLDGAAIKGVGEAKIATLQSYGIATAADIVDERVLAIPGFGPVFLKRLKVWRRQQESRFVFNPKKGVSPADRATVEQRMLSEKARLARAMTDGVAQLAAFNKEVLARRATLEHEARGAAEALLRAEADLRAME